MSDYQYALVYHVSLDPEDPTRTVSVLTPLNKSNAEFEDFSVPYYQRGLEIRSRFRTAETLDGEIPATEDLDKFQLYLLSKFEAKRFGFLKLDSRILTLTSEQERISYLLERVRAFKTNLSSFIDFSNDFKSKRIQFLQDNLDLLKRKLFDCFMEREPEVSLRFEEIPYPEIALESPEIEAHGLGGLISHAQSDVEKTLREAQEEKLARLRSWACENGSEKVKLMIKHKIAGWEKLARFEWADDFFSKYGLTTSEYRNYRNWVIKGVEDPTLEELRLLDEAFEDFSVIDQFNGDDLTKSVDLFTATAKKDSDQKVVLLMATNNSPDGFTVHVCRPLRVYRAITGWEALL